ncbi:MAG: glycosyltransferase family 39 protein [Kiritimatiellia bacterium]|jgi:4-amino-4-deoxy-L-arabinose transferase-like glycosyltransferase|nr:glycosyltransferase family 39 protein [Kiritimatiellia bacterium]
MSDGFPSVFQVIEKNKKYLAVVLGLAFALRMGFCLLSGIGEVPIPGTDDSEYDQYAYNMARGNGFSGFTIGNQTDPLLPTTFREPGTPAVYALVYATLGRNYAVVRTVQVLFSTLAVGALFYVAYVSFGVGVARLSSLWYALYPATWKFSWHTTSEAQYTLLLYLFVITLIRMARDPSFKNIAASGFTFGIAALTRAGILVLAPFMWIWAFVVFRPKWRTVVLSVLGIGVVSLIVILPWTIRNRVVQKEFVLICTRAGETFLQGNNEYVVDDPVYHGYTIQTVDMPKYDKLLKGLPEVRRDKMAFELGWEYLRENRELWLSLARWKLARQWTPLLQPHVGTLTRFAYVLTWGLVLLFGTIGFIITIVPMWRDRHPFVIAHITVLMISLNAVVFFGFARYRLPYEGLYIVLASVTAMRILDKGIVMWRNRTA